MSEVNEDGWPFTEWLLKADRYVEAICGLGLDDLVDGPSRDCWNDGVKPKDYAIMMLEESTFGESGSF
jgi:hypothetical protein